MTESVQWLQWQLWGNDTLGYHLTNVLLHLASALLAWRLLERLGLRWAGIGGAIFALHPLAVESVAWVSELKNTLSLPPFLLACCAWIDHEENPNRTAYPTALAWFCVALLAKSTAALFPFAILLFAFYKRRRIGWNDVKVAAPFFAIAAVLTLVSLWAGALNTREHVSPPDPFRLHEIVPHLAIAALAVPIFLVKFAWPVGLLPVYREWPIDGMHGILWLLLAVLVVVLIVAWRQWAGWGRAVWLGVGFFLLNLLPLQAYILAKYHSMVWSLDHLAYIVLIGPAGLVAAGLDVATRRISGPARMGVIGASVAVLGLLAVESRDLAKSFAGSDVLWTRTLELDPANWQAHNFRGLELKDEGRLPEAIAQFETAVHLKPDSADTHYDLGSALALAGHPAEAISEFQRTLEIDPRNFQACDDWGAALDQEGQTAQAIVFYHKALALNPNFSQAHNDLGNAWLKAKRYEDARREYEKAIELDPGVAIVHTNLGFALFQLGHPNEARDQFEAALKIDPGQKDARQALDALSGTGSSPSP